MPTRRTITSLAPASSVCLPQGLRRESSFIALCWGGPALHPMLGLLYPDTPSRPTITSILAQHAALPGWRVPEGMGRQGWDGG